MPYDPDNPLPLETSFRDFLLGMCRYHQALKDEAQYLRDKAKTLEGPSGRFCAQKANLITEQRKALLWMIYCRRDLLVEFFGTDQPEVIAASFELSGEEKRLQVLDRVPVRFLGLKKKDPEGGLLPRAVNWRLAHLGITI